MAYYLRFHLREVGWGIYARESDMLGVASVLNRNS
jgi:hypothetical protein